MTPSEAPATTNYYALSSPDGREGQARKATLGSALRRLAPLMADEKRNVAIAVAAMLASSLSGLLGPVVIARAVDNDVTRGNFAGVLQWAAILLGIYLVGLVASYAQTLSMGRVGRQVLYKLRNAIFTKLQQLPLDFFNQNKAGDLISRINNDTDKLNVFFAQSLMQFASNLFFMTGAAIFILTLNVRLGLTALAPAVGVLVVTRLLSAWVKHKNLASLQSLGGMSAEITESLSNFRVIVAFNRLDYFRRKFNAANEQTYRASVGAGLANNVFQPIYGLAYNLAQVAVLAYGIVLITEGQFTVGLLIGFFLYVNNFYIPLRQLAAVWTAYQQALAALDRISAVLALESNLLVMPSTEPVRSDAAVLEFEHVTFSYPGGRNVLTDSTFRLEQGKTYAFVGPTGGGKTTTASLMARLYDPTAGRVLLDGMDIRSCSPEERSRKIGFILQDPLLFTGTVRDNILYGNDRYMGLSDEQLLGVFAERNLDRLLARFDEGLQTKVAASGTTISLGQKQLIAFMRTVLRDPELLILDEATANIDTVTEQLLQQIIDKLPPSTTKVIIAHRLNTIAGADEIFFVNAGDIVPAGSMEHALDMLLHGKRAS
ncbi:MAG TPA: ABC transporter ATP-binding protein [Vicinamibacterales bacterium]|nr:ABC transporter ATP-binding protein [Vicinamibacterales bacterium]